MPEAIRQGPVEKPSGDVPAWPVIKLVAGWYGYVIVGLAVIAAVYYGVAPPGPPPSLSEFPHPRLVIHPSTEQAHLVAAQKRALEASGPVAPGFVHIPIEKAMQEDLKRPDPYAPVPP